MTRPTVIPIAGLQQNADILVDRYGIPHIYAATEDDLFFAQGFNAARERLFQLDLWLRRGLGRLSEAFGPRFLERDRASRLFLYRGDMRAEWLAYHVATKRIVTSFVYGINAFIDSCEQGKSPLPVEFRQCGYTPLRWSAADVVVIRSHGVTANLEQEVARARTVRDFGIEIEELRRIREPVHPLSIPRELLDLVPDDVLRVYRLATGPVTFGEDAAPHPQPPTTGASNAWAVSGRRTMSGRPLLASDPHRPVGVPSLRYIAHLSAPGLDVIGAGEPAVPGIAIGHNGHVAFGLTTLVADQEDLYVYETNAARPDEYRYRGRWETMQIRHETIDIAGGPSVDVELRFTRHGPVIYEDRSRDTAFAVRAAWLETGAAPYLGSLEYLRAHTAREFVDSLGRWGAPCSNHVYAAVGGEIGWQPAGLIPIRPNWDGCLPVSGDGSHEWGGFYEPDCMPSLRDPNRGWVATANENNFPSPSGKCTVIATYDWPPRVRYGRISEVLDSAAAMTVTDCVQLQFDTLNVVARTVLAQSRGFNGTSSTARRAAAMLQAWDCRDTADSAAAALFQVWFRRHLRPALLLTELRDAAAQADPDVVARRLLDDETRDLDVRTDFALLQKYRGRLDKILEQTLAAAFAEVQRLLGDDPAQWRWGDLHHASIMHVLAPIVADEWTSLPRRERAGSIDTVNRASYGQDFQQVSGASFRVVVDVGDWDNSRAINTPGQSGRPDDHHWADLYDRWAGDETIPLYYSRSAVEAHLDYHIRLVPSSTAAVGGDHENRHEDPTRAR